MLTISVRLLHGTIRAGSPDDTVMAGGEPSGEWPPSPARLFSALVAADGSGERCRVTDGSELRVLEGLGPPTIHADRYENVLRTALLPRYVVKPGHAKPENKLPNADARVHDRYGLKVVHGYPDRQSETYRPGVSAAPRHPRIEYVWQDDVAREIVDALAIRAARVGYFGCSDSPATVTASTEPPVGDLPAWTPGETGVALPIPFPGFLDALDAAYDAWCGGQPVKRSWVPTRRARYAATRGLRAADQPISIWLSFDRSQPARRALLVAETLRAAVIKGTDAAVGEANGARGSRAPWILHGHDIPESVQRPYQLARFLPLMNVGYARSTGAIHGAAIWLPSGTEPETVEAVRAAVFSSARDLRAAGLRVTATPRLAQAGAWSTDPKRWAGPSTRWFSATPAVAERGRRKGPSADDVREWFVNAGHPVPDRVKISAVPTRPGVPYLHPSEVHREGKSRHPYVWLEIGFNEPVTGPLCVGRSRSFGMGLLAPLYAPPARDSVRSPG